MESRREGGIGTRVRERKQICTSREGKEGKKLNFQLTVVFNLALAGFADVVASLYRRFYVFESVLPLFQWVAKETSIYDFL